MPPARRTRPWRAELSSGEIGVESQPPKRACRACLGGFGRHRNTPRLRKEPMAQLLFRRS
eukprot:10532298-Prorocentrum_lima.AAC.1